MDGPTIASIQLGLSAYEAAKGNRIRPRSRRSPGSPALQPMKISVPSGMSGKSAKELKVSILKSLQNQSNSGTVRIRDVATALDDVLRK
ncbi:hypothetical protein [Antarcticimicrobium sp.]|uniref:hypothetical protein n=1 Tax=Antarcticimicrobium sp. TaxID=2824147 RepID=UPI002602F163|nr:hypothetical protein [Antarcticimicrobium sp.]